MANDWHGTVVLVGYDFTKASAMLAAYHLISRPMPHTVVELE
jgi:hypothetical protein